MYNRNIQYYIFPDFQNDQSQRHLIIPHTSPLVFFVQPKCHASLSYTYCARTFPQQLSNAY
jgi:hypothetical protein